MKSIVEAVTDDFVETFSKPGALDTFWVFALRILGPPAGVDPADPRVVQILEKAESEYAKLQPHCPHCKNNEPPPRPWLENEFGTCALCGELVIFKEGLLQIPTPEERAFYKAHGGA